MNELIDGIGSCTNQNKKYRKNMEDRNIVLENFGNFSFRLPGMLTLLYFKIKLKLIKNYFSDKVKVEWDLNKNNDISFEDNFMLK